MSGSKDSGDPSGQDPQSHPKANSLRNSPSSPAAPAAMDRSVAVRERPSRAGNALRIEGRPGVSCVKGKARAARLRLEEIEASEVEASEGRNTQRASEIR